MQWRLRTWSEFDCCDCFSKYHEKCNYGDDIHVHVARKMTVTVMMMISVGKCGEQLPSVWQPYWAHGQSCFPSFTTQSHQH